MEQGASRAAPVQASRPRVPALITRRGLSVAYEERGPGLRVSCHIPTFTSISDSRQSWAYGVLFIMGDHKKAREELVSLLALSFTVKRVSRSDCWLAAT